jgi:hypothetical protein
MIHEHQRRDRDDHVYWNCAATAGYQPALNRARQAGEANAEKRLCSELAFSQQYGFGAAMNFLKADDSTFSYETDGPSYDFLSIMQYASNAMVGRLDMCTRDPGYCTLMKWKDNGNGGKELDWIPGYEKPSA